MAIICSLGNWGSEGQPHKNALISTTEHCKKKKKRTLFCHFVWWESKAFFHFCLFGAFSQCYWLEIVCEIYLCHFLTWDQKQQNILKNGILQLRLKWFKVLFKNRQSRHLDVRLECACGLCSDIHLFLKGTERIDGIKVWGYFRWHKNWDIQATQALF